MFIASTKESAEKEISCPKQKQQDGQQMEDSSDEILWSLYMKGNRLAIDQIYRRYYPLLLNYGCKLSCDQELVQDCIQNLFMDLMTKSKSLSIPLSVRGYLLKSFRNNLFQAIGKEEKYVDFIFDVPDTFCMMAEEDENFDEDVIDMWLAYKKLSTKQKEILYLFYIKKIPHKDIANLLNINYQSSKNRLVQSLIQLRKIFFSKKK